MQVRPMPDKTRVAKINFLPIRLFAEWTSAESLSLLNIAGKPHKLPPFPMAATVIQGQKRTREN